MAVDIADHAFARSGPVGDLLSVVSRLGLQGNCRVAKFVWADGWHDRREHHVDRLVADVVELTDQLGERVHLVGHDWGGQVAAAFAASFSLDPAQAERSKHHRRFDDPTTAGRLLDEDARRLRRMLAGSGVHDDDIDGYLAVLGERDALDAAVNWYRAARGAGLRAVDTPAITVPTCYIWGTEDASVGRAAAAATGDHVTGPYRFVEIAGGGHFLTDDGSNDAVTESLLDHLARR